MKHELNAKKLKDVKLWITAGPREKFTLSEVIMMTGFQFSLFHVIFNL